MMYIYVKSPIKEEVRLRILKKYCSTIKIGNHYWEYEDNCILNNGIDFIVTAWAELPEPYNPEEPEDNHPDAITARKYAEGDPETVKALHIFDEQKNERTNTRHNKHGDRQAPQVHS